MIRKNFSKAAKVPKPQPKKGNYKSYGRKLQSNTMKRISKLKRGG